MGPAQPHDGTSTPDATGQTDPRAMASVTPPAPPKSGASIWPLVLIGILAVLWVVPGAGVMFLMAWGIEGDSPSPAQVSQASLVGQVWMLGLVGLIALFVGLIVMRYLQR
jgi:hypothetical protein